MICILALVAFSVMGIFSARYRKLAREAFSCVFRKITLRACETGLDQRVRISIVSKIMRRSKRGARWVNKHFEGLSWAFTILFFLSLGYSAYGVVNYVAYGNCNGPHSDEFCIFNYESNSEGPSCGSAHCAAEGCDCGENEENCVAPDYAACEGDCDCDKEVCG